MFNDLPEPLNCQAIFAQGSLNMFRGILWIVFYATNQLIVWYILGQAYIIPKKATHHHNCWCFISYFVACSASNQDQNQYGLIVHWNFAEKKRRWYLKYKHSYSKNAFKSASRNILGVTLPVNADIHIIETVYLYAAGMSYNTTKHLEDFINILEFTAVCSIPVMNSLYWMMLKPYHKRDITKLWFIWLCRDGAHFSKCGSSKVTSHKIWCVHTRIFE